MRELAVYCTLLLVALGCSSKKDETGKRETAARDASALQSSHPGGPPSPRGHPPQTFANADTNGRLLAQDAEHIYWIERKPEGSFVHRGNKAGGSSERLVGPVGTVVSLAVDGESLYLAVGMTVGRSEQFPVGVFRAPAKGGEPSKIFDEPGDLLARDGRVLVLLRGHREQPGRIVEVDGAGTVSTRVTVDGGLGRAALAASGDAIYWLRDRREQRGGVTVRTGSVHVLRKGDTEPTLLADHLDAPGAQLKLHGQFLYLTATDDRQRARLYRVPTSGGTAEAMSAPVWEVARFAVDDSGVYVYANRKGWKIAKLAEEPVVLSSVKVRMASDLLADDSHLYWGDSGTILRASKTLPTSHEGGGSPRGNAHE